jgi:hypothetical protein
MNWKLIFTLSLFGLAMGFATVYIIPSTIEPVFWLVIFIVCAFLVARYATGKYFLHGLMISIFNSLWITAVHMSLFYAYIANHPEFQQMLDTLPPAVGGHPRRLMLPIGLISGVIFGVIQGLFCWVASKFVKPASAWSEPPA